MMAETAGNDDTSQTKPPDSVDLLAADLDSVGRDEIQLAFKRMTPQKARFTEKFLVTGNARLSAIYAGYAASHAYSYGCKLLRDSNISVVVEAARKIAMREMVVSVADVIGEIRRVAFSDLRNYVNIETATNDDGTTTKVVVPRDTADLSRDEAAALASVEERPNGTIKIALHSKMDALQKLGKHLGILDDRVKVQLADMPEFAKMIARITEALKPFPEAAAAVAEALELHEEQAY